MTEREKIIDVLNKNFKQEVECTPVYTTADGKEMELPQKLCDMFNDIVTQAVIPYFADALIANGYGDVKEVERALDKAVELAYELRTEADTLSCSSCPMFHIFDSCKDRGLYEECPKRWKEELIRQAKKELAEEKKDE